MLINLVTVKENSKKRDCYEAEFQFKPFQVYKIKMPRSICSAPGKVILFGEHAVVYGVTAIAAALSDLRIVVQLDIFEEPCIEVTLHDLSPKETGLTEDSPIKIMYSSLMNSIPIRSGKANYFI